VLYISMNSIIVLGPFTAYLLFGLQTENISRVGRNLSDLYDQKDIYWSKQPMRAGARRQS
ncbi:MAG: hypothetical protein ACYDG7_03320, partial [Thermoleophilia bacterium]